MFVRNLLQSGQLVTLQAGEYVTIVPFGIPITVQYDDRGLIQKILLNHDKDDWQDISSKFLALVIKLHIIPNKIPVTGGTSYVHGVLLTEDLNSSLRNHPVSLQAELLQKFQADPQSFEFYAGDVTSLAVTFKGAVAVRQWLATAQFNLLPGYVVPRDLNDAQFEHMLKANDACKFPMIDSYILYHLDYSISYPKVQHTEVVVDSVKQRFTESGDIVGDISYKSKNADELQTVPYSTIVKYNIHADSIVIRDAELNIIHSISGSDSKKVSQLSRKIQCSSCGRQLIVPDSGSMRCSDPQCNSVLYPRVLQLCKCLNLPLMPFTDYVNYSSTVGSIFSILDIFDIEPYKGIKCEVTLAQGVRAVVPKTIIPGLHQINQLCDACGNSIQTLQYYIQNVDKLKMDLDLEVNAFRRFFDWIASPDNYSDIIEFFKLPNVSLIKQSAKFEGDPIFRDKLIMITGSFIHGSAEEISSILKSYAADVTTTYSDDVNCILIGDAQENIDGHAVIAARKHMIPILTESQFFSQYDIDSDLAENL